MVEVTKIRVLFNVFCGARAEPFTGIGVVEGKNSRRFVSFFYVFFVVSARPFIGSGSDEPFAGIGVVKLQKFEAFFWFANRSLAIVSWFARLFSESGDRGFDPRLIRDNSDCKIDFKYKNSI